MKKLLAVLALGLSALFVTPAFADEAPAPTETVTTPTPAPKAPKSAPKAKVAAKRKEKKAAKKKPSGKSGASKGLKGPAVLKTYAPNYRKGGKSGDAKTAGGNKAIDCGDKVADMFSGLDLDAVYAKAVPVLNKALEGDEKPHTVASLKKQYGHLNLGMQRMNVGNRVRAILYPRAAKK